VVHRARNGRLHRIWDDVFAVGRPELTQRGWWVAALLACGRGSALSHGSAMAYHGIGSEEHGLEVSVPPGRQPRCPRITVHRRRNLQPHHIREEGPIRVTNPALAMIDFAAKHTRDEVEEAVNAAEWNKVISAETLRHALEHYRGWNGVSLVREILDRRTFRLTQSRLERLFIPIAVRAGLGMPQSQQWVNGYRVDFYWPDLGLVVETDGGEWHASAAQQTVDRRRDQAHAAAGLTTLRFTHAQTRYDADHVEQILRAVVARLSSRPSG
jgi:very-short-patch-repair endonuclease